MIPLAAFALAACLPVGASDHITTADLAGAFSEWNRVQPAQDVALAPVPGVVRVLREADVARLALKFGVDPSIARDVCFARLVGPLDPTHLLAVMQAHLPDARIEILDFSRAPVPEGVLEFPLGGLKSGYWYGSIAYSAGHKFAVWARVRIRVRVKRIVASADLLSGQAIEAAQLREEVREEFALPEKNGLAESALANIVGLVPRRTIRAGTVVRREWLDTPRLVRRGEMVTVEVMSGSTRLESAGVAENSGGLGDLIAVQNPDSKRRFRARVEARGRVSVKAGL